MCSDRAGRKTEGGKERKKEREREKNKEKGRDRDRKTEVGTKARQKVGRQTERNRVKDNVIKGERKERKIMQWGAVAEFLRENK